MRNFNGGLKIEDFGGGGTQKTTHKNVTRRTTIVTRRCRDKYSECCGMVGWSKK